MNELEKDVVQLLIKLTNTESPKEKLEIIQDFFSRHSNFEPWIIEIVEDAYKSKVEKKKAQGSKGKAKTSSTVADRPFLATKPPLRPFPCQGCSDMILISPYFFWPDEKGNPRNWHAEPKCWEKEPEAKLFREVYDQHVGKLRAFN